MSWWLKLYFYDKTVPSVLLTTSTLLQDHLWGQWQVGGLTRAAHLANIITVVTKRAQGGGTSRDAAEKLRVTAERFFVPQRLWNTFYLTSNSADCVVTNTGHFRDVLSLIEVLAHLKCFLLGDDICLRSKFKHVEIKAEIHSVSCVQSTAKVRELPSLFQHF